jgi:hypothetical protein
MSFLRSRPNLNPVAGPVKTEALLDSHIQMPEAVTRKRIPNRIRYGGERRPVTSAS